MSIFKTIISQPQFFTPDQLPIVPLVTNYVTLYEDFSNSYYQQNGDTNKAIFIINFLTSNIPEIIFPYNPQDLLNESSPIHKFVHELLFWKHDLANCYDDYKNYALVHAYLFSLLLQRYPFS